MSFNATITPCLEPCTNECDFSALYSVIGVLSAIVLFLLILSGAFFRAYKKEQKARLTMWKVKMKDISSDLNQASPSVPVKVDVQSSNSLESSKEIQKRKQRFTETVFYKGRLVAVKRLQSRRMSLDRPHLRDLDDIFVLNHEHLCKFYGANYSGGYVTLLTEYCSRGSLQDLLNGHLDWDDIFKNSLIFDIVHGMKYLHSSTLSSHGNLKPSNCLIDNRFVVKITDFGMIGQRLKGSKKSITSKYGMYHKKLWTAPEILRAIIPPQGGTKKGDVYSFAIIAQEILYQKGVFYRKEDSLSHEDIIERVTSPKSAGHFFRPTLEDDDDVIIHEVWRKTLKKCWEEKEKNRITFDEVLKQALTLKRNENLVDSLLQRLQKYSDNLEEKVEEKAQQYKDEKEKSDFLLYQMLPKSVADTLRLNKEVMPESYDQVTVYFSDIVGFSAICHKSKPLEVVQMLNDLYTMFDQIIDEFDVYKVETIGDAYMVVSGLPIRNGNNHAREIARMALRLRDSVSNEFFIKHLPDVLLKLRVGIHTGPVVAGVVGLKMPRYCLFGDTVNTAARMEQSGKELKIHLSPQTKEVLDEFSTFQLRKRRQSVVLKGLGEWDTWWLTGENGNSLPRVGLNFLPRLSITGCHDDEDTVSPLPIISGESGTELVRGSTPDNRQNIMFNYENEIITRKRANTSSLYERRSSNYSNNTKYKPALSKKRRRHGVVTNPTFSSQLLQAQNTNRSSTLASLENLESSEESETISEDGEKTLNNGGVRFSGGITERRRKKHVIGKDERYNEHDSGLSLAFDNVLCDEAT